MRLPVNWDSRPDGHAGPAHLGPRQAALQALLPMDLSAYTFKQYPDKEQAELLRRGAGSEAFTYSRQSEPKVVAEGKPTLDYNNRELRVFFNVFCIQCCFYP